MTSDPHDDGLKMNFPFLRKLIAERLSEAIAEWDNWDGEVPAPAGCDFDWSLDEYLADVSVRVFVGWLPQFLETT